MQEILMIIKGLFRRYERWNPVHPTTGAFWGMGIGIGCGVGWGPGFGPEVIGYVGAGCGVGFSVGITLAGVGIGLPANILIGFPYNAVMATGTSALGFAGDGWNVVGPRVSHFQSETKKRLSNFNQKHSLGQKVDMIEIKKRMIFQATSLMECVLAIRNHDQESNKGSGAN